MLLDRPTNFSSAQRSEQTNRNIYNIDFSFFRIWLDVCLEISFTVKSLLSFSHCCSSMWLPKKPRNAWFFEKRNNSSSVNYGAYFCTRWFKPSSSNIVVFLVLALGKRSGSLNWTARATISGFGILSPAELSVVRVIQPSRVNLSNPYSLSLLSLALSFNSYSILTLSF